MVSWPWSPSMVLKHENQRFGWQLGSLIEQNISFREAWKLDEKKKFVKATILWLERFELKNYVKTNDSGGLQVLVSKIFREFDRF